MKRSFDLFGALALMLLLALPFAALLCLQFAIAGRPLFFRQLRAGRGGRPFNLIKLRSMATGPGSDGERLTRWGAFLRSTSLDELPELWNVIRGEMSLVGPRPLPVAYLERYSPEQARRHQVRPGITGWAQVNGRNAISWEHQFELDVWYAEHRTLRLDLRILLLTLLRLFQRQGISAEGEATRTEFIGTDSHRGPGVDRDPH